MNIMGTINQEQAVAVLILALGGLFLLLNQGASFFDRLKEKPTPADTYMPIRECKIMHQSQESRIARIESEQSCLRVAIQDLGDKIEKSASERSKYTHTRINSVEEKMNQLLGKIEMICDNMKS